MSFSGTAPRPTTIVPNDGCRSPGRHPGCCGGQLQHSGEHFGAIGRQIRALVGVVGEVEQFDRDDRALCVGAAIQLPIPFTHGLLPAEQDHRNGVRRLYDLEADPAETENLIAGGGEDIERVAKVMRREARAFRQGRAGAEVSMSPEIAARLRALG